MIKEAINRILELGAVETIYLGGRLYTSKAVHPVKGPLADALPLSTLTGVKDYLVENLDNVTMGQVMLHVVDYRTVQIIGPIDGDFRQRETLIQARAHECGFPFGKYIEREDFQVGLMASFMPTKMRDDVLKYVTGIVQSAEVKTSDDGISQRVTARTGVARVAEVDLPNPVTLQPYRTFPEAQQPESDFVFRVRQIEGKIGVALFEADGGRWKLQAALNIKEWLAENILGARVIV